MNKIGEILNLLREVVEKPAMVPNIVPRIQNLVWDGDMGETIEAEVLRDLAYDLDFYESNSMARKEDNSFFGEERALSEIKNALSILDKKSEIYRALKPKDCC